MAVLQKCGLNNCAWYDLLFIQPFPFGHGNVAQDDDVLSYPVVASVIDANR